MFQGLASSRQRFLHSRHHFRSQRLFHAVAPLHVSQEPQRLINLLRRTALRQSLLDHLLRAGFTAADHEYGNRGSGLPDSLWIERFHMRLRKSAFTSAGRMAVGKDTGHLCISFAAAFVLSLGGQGYVLPVRFLVDFPAGISVLDGCLHDPVHAQGLRKPRPVLWRPDAFLDSCNF